MGLFGGCLFLFYSVLFSGFFLVGFFLGGGVFFPIEINRDVLY